MARTSTGKGGLIFLCLFLAPFLVGGVAMLYIGFAKLAQGQSLADEEVIAAFGVGTIFTLVALGFYAATFYGHRTLQEEHTRKDRFPDQPWKWNKDWDTGRVVCASRAGMIVLWLFALTFSAFGLPLMYKGWTIREQEGWIAFLAAGLFALVGIGMLAAALYKTVAWLRYGQSYCELITNPGVIGGWFRGNVHTKLRLGPNDRVNVRLQCVREYSTGSGKNRSKRTDIKWQETMVVDADKARRTADGGAQIPIAFPIPRACQPTNEENRDDRIVWQLRVSANVPGVDYVADFEIPVFITPDTDDGFDAESTDAYAITTDEAIDFAQSSKIRVRPLGASGMEIYAPPARAIGAATGATVFLALWTGVVLFLFQSDAPIYFAIVFGFFEVVIAYAVLSMWFGSARTVVDGDSVEVTHRLAGIGTTKRFHKNEIESVRVDLGMRSGDKAYYRVNLHLPGNKKRAVASAIADKDEARWIASVIETSLESA